MPIFVGLTVLKTNLTSNYAENDLITWINWFIDEMIYLIESLLQPFGKSHHSKAAMLSIKPLEANAGG